MFFYKKVAILKSYYGLYLRKLICIKMDPMIVKHYEYREYDMRSARNKEKVKFEAYAINNH